MKDHTDLNSPQQSKKASKHFKGSFWSAPSIFTNKLQKWLQKHKMKKHHNETISTPFPVQNPISDYADPRFSLDIARMSFENDPMYSFDKPRASLDGYLIGRTMVPKMHTMLSLVEDKPMHVFRTDSQIPLEESTNFDDNHDDNVPGGSAQTREYYDLSVRRRKSLDRSNSIKKTAAAVVNEMVELKCSSIVNTNANVNNAFKLGGFVDCDSRPNSLRDDCCSSEKQTIEPGFKDSSSVIENCDSKGSKKPRGWNKASSIWSFINRRGGNKEEDRYSRANEGARHLFSESCQDFREDHNNRKGAGALNRRLFRSNSSVSQRNAPNLGGSFGTVMRNGSGESNEHGKKAKNEFVLERNKSARYSPKTIEGPFYSIPRTLPPLY